jgi:hypothetical protein
MFGSLPNKVVTSSKFKGLRIPGFERNAKKLQGYIYLTELIRK